MNLVGSSVNFVHARASRVEKRDRRQPDGIFEYILSLATKKNWRNYMVGYTSYANLSADNGIMVNFS
jgi:hypothetical protein